MTREELKEHCKKTVEQCEMWAIHRGEEPSGKVYEEHKAILDILEQEPTIQDKQAESEKYQKAFDDGYANGYAQARFDYEQEPCEDAISRKAVEDALYEYSENNDANYNLIITEYIDTIPSVTQKSGKCKNCKYFEYDSVAKVDGVPLIVAHEICSKWGNGCKTSEDGYCYLFEPYTADKEQIE